MTDRELLQQVLDAWQDHWVNDKQSALLEMIRANCANCANCARCGEKNPAEIHTCTPKRKWQWLTDEEIEQVIDKHWDDPSMFVEAMEQALKEKNG